MPFLVAPGCNFDRAVCVRIAIDDAGGFERIDHAERPIEPARVVLAFEMRPANSFGPAFVLVPRTLPMPSISPVRPASGRRCTSHCQRAQMRLREMSACERHRSCRCRLHAAREDRRDLARRRRPKNCQFMDLRACGSVVLRGRTKFLMSFAEVEQSSGERRQPR